MKFIAGAPMKPATKRLTGLAVDGRAACRPAAPAVAHHHDAVAQRHRLDLVVGDEHRGGRHLGMQALDLDAHLRAQLGVEVGERLVEQEDQRVAHQAAAERHALLLAARELARPALQQLVQAQDLGGAVDRRPDLASGTFLLRRPKARLS
jgi:hypothetical protein